MKGPSTIWVWIIFVFIFLGLSCFHFIQSGKKINEFQAPERPLSGMGYIKTLGSDIDEPLRNFIEGFNSYVDKYNKTSSSQNILAALGYLAAALTAIFSLWLAKYGS